MNEVTHEVIQTTIQTDLSMLGLVMHADLVVKVVMLLLLGSSMWCWAIIFEKWSSYRTVFRRMAIFEQKFWSGQLLDQLYESLKSRVDNPLASIFVAAMEEWKRSSGMRSQWHDSGVRVGLKERLQQIMTVSASREIESLERNLSVLATIGSSATFVGLFGTVWGIMSSFQSIAASKNTTLVVVAPGIAEALLATAMGLVAAIPAMVAYNLFNARLQSIANRVDDFSQEMGHLLGRELEEGRS
jgi:biopolymer transport protein TolQ